MPVLISLLFRLKTASLYLLRSSLWGAAITNGFQYPTQLFMMADVWNFVARLAIAGKSFSEIKNTTDAAYGESSLKKTQIYAIMKTVKKGGDVSDNRGKGKEATKRTTSLINDIAAEIQKDARVTIRTLAGAYGLSKDTIHKILIEDTGL